MHEAAGAAPAEIPPFPGETRSFGGAGETDHAHSKPYRNLGNTCYIAVATKIIQTWAPAAHTQKMRHWLELLLSPPDERDTWSKFIQQLTREGLHAGAQDDVVSFIENLIDKGWLHAHAMETQIRTRMVCWQCDEPATAPPQTCISIPLGIQRNVHQQGNIDIHTLVDTQWASTIITRTCHDCTSDTAEVLLSGIESPAGRILFQPPTELEGAQTTRTCCPQS